jgi:hypothetical protein
VKSENLRLKRIVADQLLENRALRKVNRGRMKVKRASGSFSLLRRVASRSVRRRLGRVRRFRV